MDYVKIYEKEHIENGLSYSTIRTKYNIPRGTWDYHIRKLNNLSNDGRKYRCIDSYFDKIDSDEKAYVLGFLYADGYITENHRIGLLLARKDEEVAKFILSRLCPSKEVKYYNNQSIKRSPQVKFRITSKRIYNRLKELSFYTNKTSKQSDILKKIPNEWKNSFIRGFCDGDGNIRCQHVRLQSYKFSFTFSNGTDQILQDIMQHLNSQKIYSKIYAYKNYYMLSSNRKLDVAKFCKLIYENDNFSLKRKKNLALKVIELCTNTEVTGRTKKLLAP